MSSCWLPFPTPTPTFEHLKTGRFCSRCALTLKTTKFSLKTSLLTPVINETKTRINSRVVRTRSHTTKLLEKWKTSNLHNISANQAKNQKSGSVAEGGLSRVASLVEATFGRIASRFPRCSTLLPVNGQLPRRQTISTTMVFFSFCRLVFVVVHPKKFLVVS